MSDYPAPPTERIGDLRQAFADEAAAAELVAGLEEEGPAGAVAPSRLYAYATGAIPVPDAGIERALETHPGLRNAFRRMMAAGAGYHLGTAMAASDGDLLPRSGDGCRIRFERSKAEKDRFYVIIELEDMERDPPSTLVICDRDDHCHRFPLPPARRGTIQFQSEADSQLLDLLRTSDTEVLLR